MKKDEANSAHRVGDYYFTNHPDKDSLINTDNGMGLLELYLKYTSRSKPLEIRINYACSDNNFIQNRSLILL